MDKNKEKESKMDKKVLTKIVLESIFVNIVSVVVAGSFLFYGWDSVQDLTGITTEPSWVSCVITTLMFSFFLGLVKDS